MEKAITVSNVTKVFKIPHEKRDTLAQSIIGAITRGKELLL